jgi:tRNA pseudouridine38-40 synthase
LSRTVRLTIEYDGTDFHGWQVQGAHRTVQGVLEAAIRAMTGEETRVRGAGRTDAGVHARGQVAAFSTGTAIPPVGFLRGLNALLPRDVAVVAATEAAPGFDPRREARGKIYRYSFWNQEIRSPLCERFTWHVRAPLGVDAMAAAGAALVGEHDYSAFRAADCERKNTVRVVRRLEVKRAGPLVELDVEATAFLKNMVRVIAGTLCAAGRGELGPGDVASILESRDRTRAGMTAPAQGLCLIEVLYGAEGDSKEG